jgi:hypothetical protein
MDINYINSLLKDGKTVKEIRGILGISEKSFQKEIKYLGYKYNQKQRQYVNDNCSSNTLCNTKSNTADIISFEDKDSLNFISENIELLKELLMTYKKNKESNPNDYNLFVDLIDDSSIKDQKPKTIRVNYYVWEEWKEFTKKSNQSSKTLISLALKKFMEEYNK